LVTVALYPHAPARFPSLVDELPLTRRALMFAAARHEGQRREADHAPFILHPLEVAQLLRGRAYRDEVVAAAVLHDIVEDTAVEPAELERRFGSEVARLVDSVTEPVGNGSYRERKARLRDSIATAGEDALTIYAADKVAKTRELRMTLARVAGTEPDPEQLHHYWASLSLLETGLPAHPLVQQLRFELEALELLPPQPDRG
jgi:(p)ppGpp synthase/HD superfamily hydrolase